MQPKGGSAKSENISCPVHGALELLGKRWTALIIRDLIDGTKRFGELQTSLGSVSPRMLSLRLGELEEWGIVRRRIFPEVPPRVEYTLTPKGRDLKEIIDSMASWG
ncbi:MAG: winged helix-turn-helix transcriptional regulator, partial [Terriglobia bacterium]